jgi:hypothetical protein
MSQEEYQDTRTICVDFETTQVNGESRVVGASVKLCSLDLHRHWTWKVNLESEQLIQLLLEVISSLPSALFLAIYVKKFNVPETDGNLLVETFEELVSLLREMAVPVPLLLPPTQTHAFSLSPLAVGAVFPDDGDNHPITHPIALMLDDLAELKDYLEDEDSDKNFIHQARLLLPMCNDMRTMCNIYLHFVSLVWQRTNANGYFDMAANEIARRRTQEKIQSGEQCLLTEFLNMYEIEFEPST